MAFAGFEGWGFLGRVVVPWGPLAWRCGGFGEVGVQVGRGVVTERGVEFGEYDFAEGGCVVLAQDGWQSFGASSGGRSWMGKRRVRVHWHAMKLGHDAGWWVVDFFCVDGFRACFCIALEGRKGGDGGTIDVELVKPKC